MNRLLKNNRNERFNWKRIYLPLIIVPLFLCVFLSFAVYLVTNGQLKQTGQITVEKFYAQSSSIINELKIVTDSLLGNDQFISMVTQASVSDDEINKIVRTVRNQTSKTPYVQNALVISKKHDMIYTDQAVYSYDSLTSLLLSSLAFSTTEANTLIHEEDLHEGWCMPSNSYSSPYYVSVIKDSDGNRCATLVVVLTKGYLYKSLFIPNSAFSCMYNDEFRISSSIRDIPDIDFSSEKEVSSVVGEPVKIFSMTDSRYTYMTALSRNTFYRPIYIIFISFGVYVISLLLFSLVHVYTSQKKEKAFFASLIKELPQPVAGDPDIQTVIDSIRIALNNYKEEHSAFSEQSKFRDLDRMAQGYLGAALDGERAKAMNIDPDAGCYYMLRFHMIESGILNPNHRNDLICIIIETALNGFSEDRFRAVSFPQRNNDICSVLNVYDLTLDTAFIRSCVNHVGKMLEKDYGTVFACTVSSPVSDYNDISKAWQETIDLFRFVHAIDSSATFVSSQELESQPGFLMSGEFIKQMQILSSTLVLGKYEIIPEMVDEMLQTHIAPIRKDFNLAQKRLQCISTMLYETPLPSNLDSEETSRIRSEINSADSISELSEAVHKNFGTLSAFSDDTTPVTKACEYIHDQISNINLSIPEVADYAGVSVQHLSKLFKADKGMTMVEYINQYRISLSLELLAGTDLNVNAISEQTGYTNTVTFTRNFKRYVGCTPSEYRQKNR